MGNCRTLLGFFHRLCPGSLSVCLKRLSLVVRRGDLNVEGTQNEWKARIRMMTMAISLMMNGTSRPSREEARVCM